LYAFSAALLTPPVLGQADFTQVLVVCGVVYGLGVLRAPLRPTAGYLAAFLAWNAGWAFVMIAASLGPNMSLAGALLAGVYTPAATFLIDKYCTAALVLIVASNCPAMTQVLIVA
jgi:hypothetical protein